MILSLILAAFDGGKYLVRNFEVISSQVAIEFFSKQLNYIFVLSLSEKGKSIKLTTYVGTSFAFGYHKSLESSRFAHLDHRCEDIQIDICSAPSESILS